MKANFRKMAAIALALCMLMSLSAVALAADPAYYVAGTDALCGEAWNPSAAANQMAVNADGKYEKVYENVPAGTHEFKITDGSWTNAYGVDGGNSNFVFDLTEASTVTILFDAAAKLPSVLINGNPYEAAKGYFVAGAEGLTGYNWAVNAPANLMSKNADGLYEKVYENVPAGTYDFKVTPGNWDQSWGKDGGSENFKITLEKTSKVTILFNEDTKLIEAKIEPNADAPIEPPKPNVYTLPGAESLTGYDWDNSKNEMAKNADGLYEITFQSILAGTYEFKVCANANWSTCWGGDGPGGNFVMKLEQSGHVTIRFNEETKEITFSVEPVEVKVIYTVAGEEALTGANWDPAKNEMSKNADGLYEILFSNVAAGQYKFKVTTGSWANSWGVDGSDYIVNLEKNSDVKILFNAETKVITTQIIPLTPDVPEHGDNTLMILLPMLAMSVMAMFLLSSKKKHF